MQLLFHRLVGMKANLKQARILIGLISKVLTLICCGRNVVEFKNSKNQYISGEGPHPIKLTPISGPLKGKPPGLRWRADSVGFPESWPFKIRVLYLSSVETGEKDCN